MRQFCEWFRNMPIMVWPNVCMELPIISKWTSSIFYIFSWCLCDYERVMCDCQCHEVYNVYCKQKNAFIKVVLLCSWKCSYQRFLLTDLSPKRPLPNCPILSLCCSPCTFKNWNMHKMSTLASLTSKIWPGSLSGCNVTLHVISTFSVHTISLYTWPGLPHHCTPLNISFLLDEQLCHGCWTTAAVSMVTLNALQGMKWINSWIMQVHYCTKQKKLICILHNI